ncbi:GlmL-related ornithine degradation protein [Vallitalea okinawensis]|uniref:GlmL-related ornithine degradation protein n=1 Tax=Vallitalea okinawensis TaxID=2078660 RepID=UPI000CFCFE30|nr:GlmL-related ornithine degradation protein [Vallitalea okinawensis]
MKIDALVAEIGSTTTVINAFHDLTCPCPKFIGQGQAPTSVLEGDVNIGLENALKDLKKSLGVSTIDSDAFFATSSAAGGLRMTVHGLVYDMTVRAAKEAALGAGANIHFITAGKLRRSDLKKISAIHPNIILLSGGVDYGERDTAIENAERLLGLNLNLPLIYAGNIENQEEIIEIFEESNYELHVTDNVYPKIDDLNIEPTRSIIQNVFEKHITTAPGMEKVRSFVTSNIIPTPGAVMLATKLIYDSFGDVLTFDVGGATTDVHSVTCGSEEINRILISPEPKAKRTVEGDLGVYVNMNNVIDLIGKEELASYLNMNSEELNQLIEGYKAVPHTENELKFVNQLTEKALSLAIRRHAGQVRYLYGGTGKRAVAEGKDLTNTKYIIGTGGALTRLPDNKAIIDRVIKSKKETELLPHEDVKVLIDKHYIMASLGVLSKKYPEAALELLRQSLEF